MRRKTIFLALKYLRKIKRAAQLIKTFATADLLPVQRPGHDCEEVCYCVLKCNLQLFNDPITAISHIPVIFARMF